MPSRPANLTAADTAAEQGNAAATVTGVAADSVELAVGPANPTAAVPLAEQGSQINLNYLSILLLQFRHKLR